MAKEEKFTFLSADGKTTIHAVKWIPEDGKYEAILQITHGMIEFVERYRLFAEFLTENGFMVVGHDHLGHGDSVASKDDWGYFAENPSDTVIADMHALRTMIQKENPGVPYFMMGHSMGSYMLRKSLTIHNDDLRGAIIMGTGCVPDNTTKLGINVCKFLAKIFGWHHRSRLVESLSFGGPYKKYDLSGKTAVVTGGITGLGLAIVKHIVAQHGAKLTLESEQGKGTEIRVEFSEALKQHELETAKQRQEAHAERSENGSSD